MNMKSGFNSLIRRLNHFSSGLSPLPESLSHPLNYEVGQYFHAALRIAFRGISQGDMSVLINNVLPAFYQDLIDPLAAAFAAKHGPSVAIVTASPGVITVRFASIESERLKCFQTTQSFGERIVAENLKSPTDTKLVEQHFKIYETEPMKRIARNMLSVMQLRHLREPENILAVLRFTPDTGGVAVVMRYEYISQD